MSQLVGTEVERNYREVMIKREAKRFEWKTIYTNSVKEFSVFPSAEGITVYGKDITERRKIEEALRVSEEKANALIKYAPTGIYEIDYRIPRYTSVNDAMCQILGYTREELLATNPADLLDEEGKVLFRERIMKLIAGQKVDENVEFKVKAKDGRIIYAVLRVMFLYKNGVP